MRMPNMKSIFALAVLSALLCEPAFAAGPRLTLPEFQALEEKASEVVSVTLDSALLGLAAGFLDDKNPEDAAVKDVVAGLTGVYVKSFTFDADFEYPKADVDKVRRQLSAPGWQRLVEVRSRKEGSRVDVYISMDRNKANGLAIIASEPRELTIVNIVGSVDLQKLHQLEGKFGVPRMQLENSKREGVE
jgi:hypothetical protein